MNILKNAQLVLTLVVALAATNCSRRIINGDGRDNQSGIEDCVAVTAEMIPLSFSGSSITRGTEVLWQVTASGCAAFRLTRSDDGSIRSFANKTHFTKRYTSAAQLTRETILLTPIAEDGSAGSEMTIQSAAFTVTGSGGGDDGGDVNGDDEDDTNAPLLCRAIADFSTLNARKNGANWDPAAPWVGFTITTNKPAYLMPSGDSVDTTYFPSGIPSAQALTWHRVNGQLQKADLNAVVFRVARASDPTEQVTCVAPVSVNIVQPPPPPALSCNAYGVPGSIAAPVGASGNLLAPVNANLRIDANRLTFVTGARLAGVPHPVASQPSAKPSHNLTVALNTTGWHEIEFDIVDGASAGAPVSCRANVWVYGTQPPLYCDLQGPDNIFVGQEAALQLVAYGPYYNGSIDGFGYVLPGTGRPVVQPKPGSTVTYVGKVVGPHGIGYCTKTVVVTVPPVSCQLIASASSINPGQTVKLSLLAQGTYHAAQIDVPGEGTRNVLSTALSTDVTLNDTATFTGRLIGPTATAICTQTVVVNPTLVGVHLEDWTDNDYNDSVVCLNGYLKTVGQYILSTKTQTVSANAFKFSSLNHDVRIRVFDSFGTVRQTIEYQSSSRPTFSIYMEKDWKIEALFTSQITHRQYDSNRIRVSPFCTTWGN